MQASALVPQLAAALLARAWALASAESCTGGLIAAACTDWAGSSQWFERGYVCYSNAAKHDMLGVPLELIAAHGAVSEAVVRAMAQGACTRSGAQVSVAVSGIAGPSGASAQKPVGTVWLAWCVSAQADAQCLHFSGDRHAVRQASTVHALRGLVQRLANGLT